MKNISWGRSDSQPRKPNTTTLMTWLSALNFLRKRRPKTETSDAAPVYDVENIRKSEYPSLEGEIYLDHAGTTPFPRSALDHFVKDVTSNLYGNPHSENKSSRQSTQQISDVRLRALQFFNASPDDFDLVFVQNATAAIKLAVEILRSQSEAAGGFWYGYHGDSHTSLVGVREVAGAGFACFDRDRDVEDWIATGRGAGSSGRPVGQPPHTRLFAYPGQSNMTGRRLPLSWPGRLRASKLDGHTSLYTLLDAAALASTAELDLSNPEDAPDFVALSFYKIFGFPDLGALLVRRAIAPVLRGRKYFGGGTVEMVMNGVPWHSSKTEHPHEYLEDGTLPFHNIIALGHALTTHAQLYTSQKLVSRHTARLAKYLYSGLSDLRHSDGSPVCIIYQDPYARYGDASSTGPTVAFNIRYLDGTWVKLAFLETLAEKHDIHLRTGGVCNPGGIARALHLAPWELLRNYTAGTRCGQGPVVIGGKPSGIARVSLGAMSTVRDVDTFLAFVRCHFRNARPPDSLFEWRSGMSLSVAAVMIYPLDGASGWRVPEDISWPVEPSGLRWDGAWFIVNLDTLEVLSRETSPKLVLLYPEVDITARLLRIRQHRSLETSVFSEDAHICIPLEENSAVGIMGRTDCSSCGGRDIRISTRTVRYGNLSAPAPACMSKDVIGFLSSALGINCTVAKIADPALRDALMTRQPPPHAPSESIVVGDAASRSPSAAENPERPSTRETAHIVDEKLDIRPVGSNRPRYEALMESMQANIALIRNPLNDDQESLFMSVGRQFSKARNTLN